MKKSLEETAFKNSTIKIKDNLDLSMLIEDYQRKIKTISEMIINNEDKKISDIERLKTKRSCYRTFLTELERLKVSSFGKY